MQMTPLWQKMKIMVSGPITSREIDMETVSDFIWGAPKSLQMVIAAMKLKDTYALEGAGASWQSRSGPENVHGAAEKGN